MFLFWVNYVNYFFGRRLITFFFFDNLSHFLYQVKQQNVSWYRYFPVLFLCLCPNFRNTYFWLSYCNTSNGNAFLPDSGIVLTIHTNSKHFHRKNTARTDFFSHLNDRERDDTELRRNSQGIWCAISAEEDLRRDRAALAAADATKLVASLSPARDARKQS